MTISIFNKSKRYQRPDIKDNDQINQLPRCYDVSKRLVSFRYHLKRLCDVLNWSVPLMYQLVHCYDVSNSSVLFTYQRHWKNVSNRFVLLTCQFRRRDDVSEWSRTFKRSLKWINFFWVLGSTFFQHLRWFSLFKLQASMSLQRLKDVSLIQVPVVTSQRRVKLVSLTQFQLVRRYDVLYWLVFFMYQ